MVDWDLKMRLMFDSERKRESLMFDREREREKD